MRATLVLSMKDWKKKISPKISKDHKKSITNRRKNGTLEKSKDMNTVFTIELTKLMTIYWIKYDKK
jgi:hypothetical protein